MSNVIEEVEVRYPEMTAEFKRQQEADYLLFCKKQLDYGPGNISMGTSLEDPKDLKVSLTGIVIRVKDKIERLVQLIIRDPRDPSNESIYDTFQDLSNYAIIARIVKSGNWGK